jgi:protein pelota
MRAPEISKMLQGAKFAREGVGLEKWVPLTMNESDGRFHKMLSTDELRAWYGPDHVALAVDRGAVGTLLISDNLFRYVPLTWTSTDPRASEPAIRHHYVEMVEAVRSRGGEALIFSSMHESGQQLDQISGIAAILTYPLDVEIVEMEEREEKERIEREKEGQE